MGNRVRVGTVADFADGELHSVDAAGTGIVVGMVDGRTYAARNRCPHLGFSLTKGPGSNHFEGGQVTCPWHNSSFDFCTGENLDWAIGFAGKDMPRWSAKMIGLAGGRPRSRRTWSPSKATRSTSRSEPAPQPVPTENGQVVEVEPERFEEMVTEALDGLPVELGRIMSNVAVTVEHNSGPPGLLGLYQGIPLSRRTTTYAGVLPDRITIYRRAICRICRTEDDVVEQVRRTVVHEIGHHFGLADPRLRELGY